MGNSSSQAKSSKFLPQQNQLSFYTQTIDPNLGIVKIYTCKNKPLRYILKHQQIAQDTRIYNIFQKVQKLQSPSLLQLHGFNIERQTCCTHLIKDKIISYWDYHNFYLNIYLKKRIQHNCVFIDSQIWHFVDVCCEAFQIFKKYDIYYEIDPRTFIVTPQGKLKAFWCHLKSQNHHLQYLKYFQKRELQSFYYSPEELQLIYENQRTPKINIDKCNTFRLGMILLQCLSMSQPLKLCYNPSMTKINFMGIKNLIVQKIMPNYGEDITRLLKKLLSQNAKDRPTFQQIYDQFSIHFNPQFQLRVCASNTKQKKISKYEIDKDAESMNVYQKLMDDSIARTIKIKRSGERPGWETDKSRH